MFNKPPSIPTLSILVGSKSLFELSEGELIGTLKNGLAGSEGIGFKTTTSLSGIPVDCPSPKSWSAIIFLKLFPVVVFTLFCLLVAQTSRRVICTLLSIKG